MSRNIDREEMLRIAAEKFRKKKEQEKREEEEFYQRITTGPQWIMFVAVVIFCTAMSVVFTIETFVDGPTKKISESEWKINRDWEWTWHKIVEVEGYLFAPELKYWGDRKENTLKLTYSPIFRTGKELRFDMKPNDEMISTYIETRWRSIFNWFPLLQIFLLIPLATYIFKRRSPWFNFARIVSLVFVFPGTLVVIFFSMM